MFQALHYTYVNGLVKPAAAGNVKGLAMMFDATGKAALSDGTKVSGIFAQDVKAVPDNGYRPDFDDAAYMDGNVGVYQGHLVFLTDQFKNAISTYQAGDKIYVTSDGKYTNVRDNQTTPAPTPTTGIVEIGEVVLVESNAIVIRAKL